MIGSFIQIVSFTDLGVTPRFNAKLDTAVQDYFAQGTRLSELGYCITLPRGLILASQSGGVMAGWRYEIRREANRRETFTLTREQLYDFVWSQAIQRIAEQVGISNVAIAKRCRVAHVPVPGRGYWNRKEAGYRVKKRPLPPRDLAIPQALDISGALTDELRSQIKGEPGIETEDEDIDALTQRFRCRLGLLRVPRTNRFYTLHPAIAHLLAKNDEFRRKNQEDKYYFREPLFDTPFERRRLILLNHLFLGLASVGCGAEALGEGVRELCAYIGGNPVRFTLDAVDARSDDFMRNRQRSRPAASPAALQIFASSSPRRQTYWVEDETDKLSNHLTEIIISMAIVAEEARRSGVKHRATQERVQKERLAAEAQQRAIEAARRERERIEDAERDRVSALRTYAERWKTASVIREFIKSAKLSLAGRYSAEELSAWTLWAERVAADIDPLGDDQSDNRIAELFASTRNKSA